MNPCTPPLPGLPGVARRSRPRFSAGTWYRGATAGTLHSATERPIGRDRVRGGSRTMHAAPGRLLRPSRPHGDARPTDGQPVTRGRSAMPHQAGRSLPLAQPSLPPVSISKGSGKRSASGQRRTPVGNWPPECVPGGQGFGLVHRCTRRGQLSIRPGDLERCRLDAFEGGPGGVHRSMYQGEGLRLAG